MSGPNGGERRFVRAVRFLLKGIGLIGLAAAGPLLAHRSFVLEHVLEKSGAITQTQFTFDTSVFVDGVTPSVDLSCSGGGEVRVMASLAHSESRGPRTRIPIFGRIITCPVPPERPVTVTTTANLGASFDAMIFTFQPLNLQGERITMNLTASPGASLRPSR